MTESVHGITVISSSTGGGSGLANKREKPKRRYQDPEQDTVSISAEARNLNASSELYDAPADDTEDTRTDNGER